MRSGTANFNPLRCLKLSKERAIYLDLASTAFERVVSSLRRERMSRSFKAIKNHSSHFNFENSSKKIFFKIGLATLLLTIQKYDYRSAKFALKKLKKNQVGVRCSQERLSSLFKRFCGSRC